MIPALLAMADAIETNTGRRPRCVDLSEPLWRALHQDFERTHARKLDLDSDGVTRIAGLAVWRDPYAAPTVVVFR